MKDDWISFPTPGAGEDWTRVSSIVSVEAITALTLAQAKLAREIDRAKLVSEHPATPAPDVNESPDYRELKQAKAIVRYVPKWGAFQGDYGIRTTQTTQEAIGRIKLAEGERRHDEEGE